MTSWQDLRYACVVAKSPGIMLVAVLTLGAGRGPAVGLFSMLRQWVIEAVSVP